MGLEFNDGKITGSSGTAKAGLTLGIIGTALAVLGNGNGWNGIFGGGAKSELESEVAQLRAEKYTDDKSLDLYTQIVSTKADSDARVASVQSQIAIKNVCGAIKSQSRLSDFCNSGYAVAFFVCTEKTLRFSSRKKYYYCQYAKLFGLVAACFNAW